MSETYHLDVEYHGQRMNAETAKEMVYDEMRRPFHLLRPKVYRDGDKWCALLGDDLMSGVFATGDSPEEAATAFDVEWKKKSAPNANR